STAASSAADLAVLVRSNASSISMISSSFLVTTLPPTWAWTSAATFRSNHWKRRRTVRRGFPLSAGGEISCPSAGSSVSVYGEFRVAAVNRLDQGVGEPVLERDIAEATVRRTQLCSGSWSPGCVGKRQPKRCDDQAAARG